MHSTVHSYKLYIFYDYFISELNNFVIVWSIKYQQIMKNAYHKLKVMSTNCMFCLTNSPKSKDFQFYVT